MSQAAPTTGSSLLSQWPTLVVAALGSFLVIMDVTIVAIALPSIERELRASFAELQWIVNAYNIAYTSVLMAVGALADRVGRRRVFVIGLALFGVTSLVVGMAETPMALIVGRLAQGLSASAMLILGVALLSNAFQGPERAQAFAVWGVAIGVGAAFGPMVGGLLVDMLSWRWIFLLNVPVVAILIAVCYWRVEESSAPQTGRFDWPGVITFTAALAALSFAVIQGGELGWSNPVIVWTFAAAAALFVAFVLIERSVAAPAFDLRLFRISTFTGAQLLGSLNSITFWVMLVYLPIYFQVMYDMSASAAGLMLMPLTVPLLLLAPLGARLSAPNRLGVRGLLTFGCALIAIGFVWLAAAPPVSIAVWVGVFLVIGVGAGLINGELSNVATAVVPPERAGMASGVNITFRHGSFTLAISVIGAILITSVTMELGQAPGMAAALGDGLSNTANMIARGDFAGAVAGAPQSVQPALTQFGRASFASAFSFALGLVALWSVLAVLCSALMIRRGHLAAGPAVANADGSSAAD
jgi:EmrB/QacA subfamily drug resistance transporter